MHPHITSHQNLKEKPTIQYIKYPMKWKSAVKWKEGRKELEQELFAYEIQKAVYFLKYVNI
jgi:hypothetical protein